MISKNHCKEDFKAKLICVYLQMYNYAYLATKPPLTFWVCGKSTFLAGSVFFSKSYDSWVILVLKGMKKWLSSSPNCKLQIANFYWKENTLFKNIVPSAINRKQTKFTIADKKAKSNW